MCIAKKGALSLNGVVCAGGVRSSGGGERPQQAVLHAYTGGQVGLTLSFRSVFGNSARSIVRCIRNDSLRSCKNTTLTLLFALMALCPWDTYWLNFMAL